MEPVPKGQSGSNLSLFFNAVLIGPCVAVIAAGLAAWLGGTSWFLDANASPLRLVAALALVGWGYVIFRVALSAYHSRAGSAVLAAAAVLWSAAAGFLLIAVSQG